MINNYVRYLEFLNEKFERFFKSQEPYIFCKKGCGKCCKGAQFPYSQMEATYLMYGAQQLDETTAKKVMENIQKVKQQKSEFKGERFRYDCPFLINDECCVYEYRGIICRAFGLMTIDNDEKVKVPFCCFDGYNYSNVMQDDGKNVSPEKFKALGVKEEPVAFNVRYENLTDEDIARGFNFRFGEKKPLIDWL